MGWWRLKKKKREDNRSMKREREDLLWWEFVPHFSRGMDPDARDTRGNVIYSLFMW